MISKEKLNSIYKNTSVGEFLCINPTNLESSALIMLKFLVKENYMKPVVLTQVNNITDILSGRILYNQDAYYIKLL